MRDAKILQIAKSEAPLRPLVAKLSLTTIAFGAACALPIVMVIVIKACALRVPFGDEWAWADLVYHAHLGTLSFAELWRQHNEHRMLFPNLIALGLASLGGWSQVRETLFSLLIVVVTQIGIFFLLRRAVSPVRLPYAFLIASLLLYSLAQMENWDWGFQLAWFLCNACAVWALLLLGTAGQSWFALIAAMLIATIASYSSSQGLMIWPAGIAALVLVQKRRPLQIVVWTIVAGVVFFGYFHGYQKPSGHPDLLSGVHHPLTYVRYIGAYFGSVFANWLGFGACVTIGWAGLVVLGGLLAQTILTYRSDRVRASRGASWVGIAAYALFVAAITGVGRVGFGEAQAEASRYASIAIYLWIAIAALVFALDVPARLRQQPTFRAIQMGAAVAFSLLYIGSNEAGLALGEGRSASVRAAFPAMVVGSGPQLTALYPSEPFVEQELRQLKAVKDGPYYQ